MSTSTKRTIMIMAGGTGGHIMPGLAVAQVLQQRGWQVVWMGNPDAMEGKLVPPEGLPMARLTFAGLRGKGWFTRLALPWRLFKACHQAWRHFRRYRPDVVLGMGGYVAFPGGLVARWCGVPLVLHEQNAMAGLTNRVLAKHARRVLTGFPDTLPGAVVTGNPVRQSLAAMPAPEQRWVGRNGPLRLLIVGGSLGAQALNTVVPQAMALLRQRGLEVPQIVHQAGAAHGATLRAAYTEAGVVADCRSFIDDMAEAYGMADLVICRAGAMTVAEVAAAGVAALFVPFPHAVDDHQTRNAQYLAQRQAAWLMPQADLTPAALADWLVARQRDELLAVATRARALAQPDAATRIADICAEQARRRGT